MNQKVLSLEWWEQLEEQWKIAFNQAFWKKADLLAQPTNDELKDLRTTPTLRIVGPGAPFSNCSIQLTNLKGLTALTQIEMLFLTDHNIRSIESLKKMSKLNTLFIHNNPLKSIDGIQGLKQLKELFIQNTQIESLAPIHSLSSLQTLNCAATQINKLVIPPNLKTLMCIPNENLPDREIIRVENRLGIRCRQG